MQPIMMCYKDTFPPRWKRITPGMKEHIMYIGQLYTFRIHNKLYNITDKDFEKVYNQALLMEKLKYGIR